MTKTNSIEIEIQCPECEDTVFETPENVQDDDFVVCNQCNFQIMLADLKKINIERVQKLVHSELKKAIENSLKSL